jgi:hypothetical protein
MSSRDKLLDRLDELLDRAVNVVPRPRTEFAGAIEAMFRGRYDTPTFGRGNVSYPRLEVHETLARDIEVAMSAGVPDREVEFRRHVKRRLTDE